MASTAHFPVSFEVYPPRSPELLAPLHESIRALESVGPEFISVTYGAGGSSTRGSLEVLRFIRDHTRATPLAHLTCVGTSTEEATSLIGEFVAEGITQFLALRGDLPEGHSTHHGDLAHASDLVSLMNSLREEADHLDTIAVAAFPTGHPESTTAGDDIRALRAKQDAGADFAITQLFFDVAHYLDFVDRARAAGITLPLLPGLMPVTSMRRLNRVLELTHVPTPDDLHSQLSRASTPKEAEERGIAWTVDMVRQLRDAGAPGIHLYAFNQHAQVLQVLGDAGVR